MNLQSIPLKPITLDSRKAGPGIIFVASPGATPQSQDGHNFIHQAIEQACAGIILEKKDIQIPAHIPYWIVPNSRIVAAQLTERYYHYPSKDLNLCAITGTNGKTTVSFLLSSIAQAAGRISGVLGTLGFGSIHQLTYSGFTTPEAEDLSKILANLKNQGFQQIAIEVSSHALATYRVDGLFFKAAAFTNLSQDHLDFHGDLKNYLAAKIRLFTELIPINSPAILPQSFTQLISECPQKIKLTWGYSKKADIQASQIQFTNQGVQLKLRIQNKSALIQCPIWGQFNIDNLLCAAGLAYATGISLEAIQTGFKQAILPKGRLERVSTQKPHVFVDFAHTPDALQHTLNALREITLGKLILVFGCGGNRDRQKRALMMKIAQQYADQVYITLDNPRHESPKQIIQDMCPPSETPIILDRKKAIEAAILEAQPEDLILIAGKGHENTQQIGDELRPFDDAQIAHEILLHRYKDTQTG